MDAVEMSPRFQFAEFFKVSRGMLLFRGVVLMLLGISFFLNPLLTLWWMTLCVGAVVLVDGVFMLAGTLRYHGPERFVLIADAVMMVLLGVCSIIFPLVVDIVWVMLIGIWEVLTGLQYLFVRRGARSRGVAVVSGVLSILAGLFFLFVPIGGALVAVWVLAVVLILASLLSFLVAWKL